MRVQITHLKAPWPLGAVVGDVLDLPEIPAWAAGKCKCVGDDVDVTVAMDDVSEPVATGEGEGVGQPSPGIDRKAKRK